MKIISCTIREILIPFVVSFRHSLATHSEVRSIITEIELESGHIGYGEAIPRSYVTGETIESVRSSLAKVVFPTLKNQEFKSLLDVVEWSRDFESYFHNLGKNELCVRAGAELALLDAIGKVTNTSILKAFGGSKKSVIEYSAIISAEQQEKVKQLSKKFKRGWFKQIKLKVGTDLENDLTNIKIIREIFGNKASIRIDANGSWNYDQALEFLPKYIEHGIVSVEQPMPVSKKESYPKLSSKMNGKILICIDEGLCSLDDAMFFIVNKGAHLFNLRISKNGGLVNALEIYKRAKAANINCQLGAQVGETSILSAAGRILAAVTGDLMFHEGSMGHHLLEHDLVDSPIEFGFRGRGSIRRLNGAGLGININLNTLDKLTQSYIKI